MDGGGGWQKNEKGKKDALHLPKIFRKLLLLLLLFFLFNSLYSDKMELIKRRQAKSQCQTTSEMKHSRKACKNSCQKRGGFHSPSCILMNYKEPQCSGADATFQEPCQDSAINTSSRGNTFHDRIRGSAIWDVHRNHPLPHLSKLKGGFGGSWWCGGCGVDGAIYWSSVPVHSLHLQLFWCCHMSSSNKSTSLKVKFRWTD